VPAIQACGDSVSLDTGAYDVGAPDFGPDHGPADLGVISLDVGTYDATAPDHGIVDVGLPDILISLDAGSFDTSAPDDGFVTDATDTRSG